MAVEALEFVDGTDDVGFRGRARIEGATPDELVRMLHEQIPELLTVEESLDLLRAADRLTSWAAAVQAELVSQIHQQCERDELYWSGQDNAAMAFTRATTEIAPLLRISETGASRLVSESLALTGSLQRTREQLKAGELHRQQASVIIDQARTIPDEAVPGFEETVLCEADGMTPPRLRDRCRRLRQRLHPESISARKVKAVADRYVSVEAADDGMAWLNAYLPAEQAMGIHQGLTDAARKLQCPGENRTLTQLRADVFTDIMLSGGGSGEEPGGLRPRVFVTVPVLTLLGGSEPGELDGYGPIAPDTARSLAAGASSFIRILTHPETGALLSVGRDRYAVPKDLKNWLQVRDQTCRHPGCNRQAATCEIDHTTPWSHGGETSHENLAHLCRRHHHLKSQGIWNYSQPQPGFLRAVSPSGRSYTTEPDLPNSASLSPYTTSLTHRHKRNHPFSWASGGSRMCAHA